MDDFLGAEAPVEQQTSEEIPHQAMPAGDEYGDLGEFSQAQPGEEQQKEVPLGSGENGGALGDDFSYASPQDGDGLVEQAPAEMPVNDAFLDGQAIPEPAAPPPEPENEDPRVQWRKKNQQELAQKDKQEMETRMAMKEKGLGHLKTVNEARNKRLSARKAENRANNNPKPEAGSVLEGTTWQKVTKLVSFTSGTHTKDVARMKTTLTSLNAAAA